jgi:serine/threonine-protein kinase mTOR
VPMDEKHAPIKGHLARVVGSVLDKLLAAGIADPDPHLRLTVLTSLDERFDLHLSQSANLRALFLALNDESFENREAVLGLFGRLVPHNPAYVLPGLRHRLLQLLGELKYAGAVAISASKEESTRLLGLLIRAGPRIARPYVQPILETLLPGVSDSSARVSTCALAAVSELAQVAGKDLIVHLNTLLPMVCPLALVDTTESQ